MRTLALLDAVFAEIGLTRDEAAHAAACAECARALSLVRRFEADLARAGREITPERLGPVSDLAAASALEGGRIVNWRNALIGLAAGAAVTLVVVVAQLGKWDAGNGLSALFGPEIDQGEAARAMGIPPDAVITGEDEALGLRVLEEDNVFRVAMLLLEADGSVRQLYETEMQVNPEGSHVFAEWVTCRGGLLDPDLFALVALSSPASAGGSDGAGVGGVSGTTRVFERSGATAVLFVADPGAVQDDSTYVLEFRSGGRGPVDRAASSGPIDHAAARCAQPGTATCRDWADMTAGTRTSLAEWLIEDRLEAVRTSQQLPASAGREDVVRAAAGSIDKNCQIEPPGTPLTEIVAALYD